jgi:hypothetical protein
VGKANVASGGRRRIAGIPGRVSGDAGLSQTKRIQLTETVKGGRLILLATSAENKDEREAKGGEGPSSPDQGMPTPTRRNKLSLMPHWFLMFLAVVGGWFMFCVALMLICWAFRALAWSDDERGSYSRRRVLRRRAA